MLSIVNELPEYQALGDCATGVPRSASMRKATEVPAVKGISSTGYELEFQEAVVCYDCQRGRADYYGTGRYPSQWLQRMLKILSGSRSSVFG